LYEVHRRQVLRPYNDIVPGLVDLKLACASTVDCIVPYFTDGLLLTRLAQIDFISTMGIDLWKCELHSDRLAQQRTLLDSCIVPIITGGSQRVVILPVQFLKQCGAQVEVTASPSDSPTFNLTRLPSLLSSYIYTTAILRLLSQGEVWVGFCPTGWYWGNPEACSSTLLRYLGQSLGQPLIFIRLSLAALVIVPVAQHQSVLLGASDYQSAAD